MSEKYSPAEELANLEEQRISSGLMAVYPDLWDPIEESKKEEVLEAATTEINQALREKDFARAGGLVRSLRRHFDTDIIEERLRSKEYVASSSAETFREQEIRSLLTESDWQQAVDRFQMNYLRSGRPATVPRAAEMRRFDAKRFDKEVKIDEETWKNFVDSMNRMERDPAFFMRMASDLKELDSRRFSRDVNITESTWDAIIDELRYCRNKDIAMFVALYEIALELDRDELTKRMQVSSDDWSDITSEAHNRYQYDPERLGYFVGTANKIKPEGAADISVTQEQWRRIKDNLRELTQINPLDFMVEANKFKYIQVE